MYFQPVLVYAVSYIDLVPQDLSRNALRPTHMYKPLPVPRRHMLRGGWARSLAQEVRAVSDLLCLRIRSPRRPHLPQELPRLIRSLLMDDLPSVPDAAATLPTEAQPMEGVLPIGTPPPCRATGRGL